MSALVLDECGGSAYGNPAIRGAAGGQLQGAALAAAGSAAIRAQAQAGLDDCAVVCAAKLLAPGATLSPEHAAWLELLARVHGLVAPLQVSATGRSDGVLVQAIAGAGPVTVTTLSGPQGAPGTSALSPEQAGWLERLVRLHGGIAPLQVTDAGRSDGVVTQTFSVSGDVTTVSTAP
ncbi:MAG: hypothetical protein KGM60_08860 [Comamonadaceae bacterium]|nr:hypothetical protein [Comamonadaceae bacterium]